MTTTSNEITTKQQIMRKNKSVSYDYNFWKGNPNSNELPVEQMRVLFQQLGNACGNDMMMQRMLQYGDTSGNEAIRNEIMRFISRNCKTDDYGDYGNDDDNDGDTINNYDNDTDSSIYDNANVNKNNNYIFCTTGISHGLDLIVSVCCNPGDVVYIEQPTYFLATQIFHDHHLIVHHLPTSTTVPNTKGTSYVPFDVMLFEQQLKQNRIPKPKLIYIIPIHHNPTACTMSLKDRIKLIRLSIQYDFIIVADEVYHLLDWSSSSSNASASTSSSNSSSNQCKKPARMASLWKKYYSQNSSSNSDNEISETNSHSGTKTTKTIKNGGSCISLWSLTKIWGPGIRFGWIECYNDSVISKLKNRGYMSSAGGINPMTCEMVYTLLNQSMIDQYISNTLIPSYQRRSNVLCDILLQEEPDRIRIVTYPNGGYFLWIQFMTISNVVPFLHYCHTKLDYCHGNSNGNNNTSSDCSSNDNNDGNEIEDESDKLKDRTYHLQYSLHFMPGPMCDGLYNCDDDDIDDRNDEPCSVEGEQQQQPNPEGIVRTAVTTTKKTPCQHPDQELHNLESNTNHPLSSYVRLCFAEMDDTKLRKATYVFIHKFRSYMENVKEELQPIDACSVRIPARNRINFFNTNNGKRLRLTGDDHDLLQRQKVGRCLLCRMNTTCKCSRCQVPLCRFPFGDNRESCWTKHHSNHCVHNLERKIPL